MVQVAVVVRNNKHLTQQYVGALNNFVKHELWANKVCASECCGLIDRKLCEAAKLKPTGQKPNASLPSKKRTRTRNPQNKLS